MNVYSPTLNVAVLDLVRTVAQNVVLPRFQNLAEHEVEEKVSGDYAAIADYVTIADKESEARLAEGLTRILPDAALIGEEACAADPAILANAGKGLAWIIDPIDGTGNFAAGRAPFGILIALSDGPETLAGWIYDPLTDRMCTAVRGAGAFVNGQAVRARPTGEPQPVAAISVIFMAPQDRERVLHQCLPHYRIVDTPRCAAEQYPRLVLGANDMSIFERTLPWDHAAGVLFLNEAGGRCARMDGAPYLIGDGRKGMLAATSPALWDQAAEILNG